MRKKTKKEFKAVLFIISIYVILYTILALTHPVFTVGIVLTEEAKETLANVTIEGFQNSYPSYFKTKIINQKLDVSKIRLNNESYYLNKDFFNETINQNLSQEDYTLIITSLPIKDWDKGGYGVFGEANPESKTTLSSTFYFMNQSKESNESIRQTGIHEILHMLGYVHNPFNTNGLMQYITKSPTLKMIPYYEFQLPIRAHIAKLIPTPSFNQIVNVTKFASFVLIFPILLLIEVILRSFSKKKPIILSPISITVGSLAIYLYNYSIISIIIPTVFMSAVHAVYWEYKKINPPHKNCED